MPLVLRASLTALATVGAAGSLLVRAFTGAPQSWASCWLGHDQNRQTSQ
jgi:hypothetical protein